jgi:hypothetical protein
LGARLEIPKLAVLSRAPRPVIGVLSAAFLIVNVIVARPAAGGSAVITTVA